MEANNKNTHRLRLALKDCQLGIEWNPQELIRKIEWINDLNFNEWKDEVEFGENLELPSTVRSAIEKLRDFFNKGVPPQRPEFQALDQSEWTEFQLKVYQAICLIPIGETRSYGWVASKIGRGLASRAVGQALRKNPLPILIPCHRVIASSGGLGGFMGKKDEEHPELQFKKKLLAIEYEYLNPVFSFI